MKEDNIVKDSFLLESEGLNLRVFTAIPAAWETPLPSVQIHHAGGGYEMIYDHMAADLAQRGFVGITMIIAVIPALRAGWNMVWVKLPILVI